MNAIEKNKTELEQALYYCRGAFYTAAFFSLFINILMITPAIYMLQVYDRVLSSGSESTLLVITLLLLFLFLAMGFFGMDAFFNFSACQY